MSLPSALADVEFREPDSSLSFNLSATAQASSLDLEIALSVPASYGWGAIGFGSQMKGALMFILMPDSQNGSTISVRSASGNYMPTPIAGIQFDMISTSDQGGTLRAQGTCSSCSWSGGSLSATTATQPCIWAVGPGASGVDGSGAGANIEQHSDYGKTTSGTSRS